MHRTVAVAALLALSSGQFTALGCDMERGAPSAAATTAAKALAPADHTAPGPHARPGTAPPHAHHAAGPGHESGPAHHGGTDPDCLMMTACGAASPRPARAAAIIRAPAVSCTAVFRAPSTTVSAERLIETPPPRHGV